MKLVRERCPDPMGRVPDHHHWSLKGKTWKIGWNGWLDYDHRNFGAPVELWVLTTKNVSTLRWGRPFFKKKTVRPR